jgi:hypothetical protein
LATLLLARGADPFDSQALYNTSITGDDTRWLELLWQRSVEHGRQRAWLTVQPHSIGGTLALPPIDYLLGNAVTFGHHARAEWLLAHGAKADAQHAYARRPVRDVALMNDDGRLVALLERHGAPALEPAPDIQFHRALLKSDADRARDLAAAHPELVANVAPMLDAASANRVDTVALLLDLGADIEQADQGGQRALHAAAGAGALDVIRLLIERGAAMDQPTNHNGGPLGVAAFRGQRAAAELLAPLSREVNPLAYFGFYPRLEALFAAEPSLVNAVHVRTGNTPLFTLPQDEEEAIRMAEFLLAHGADPSHRNSQRQTADQFLRARGLLDVADEVESRRET